MSNNFDVNQMWEDYAKNYASQSQSEFPKSSDTPFTPDTVAEFVHNNDDNDKLILEQFKENEIHKRKLKFPTLVIISVLSAIQLLFMNFVIVVVILGLVAGEYKILFITSIDSTLLPEIFGFLKFYITATIVELLGMLSIMVTKIFDNPIKEFFKINHDHKQK